MERSTGRPEVTIALIDGPVVMDHPDLAGSKIREVSGNWRGRCALAQSTACLHGTFVAGILSARRGSSAPAICPGSTLLVRPIFSETVSRNDNVPTASPEELANAIVETVEAGANIINLSAAIAQPSLRTERSLNQALELTASRGVIIVAAAGNQGMLGSTVITRHPWVIPVVACDVSGRPTSESNLGNSIGRRGLSAPGRNISSLGTNGKPQMGGGTSAAAPFVTGAIALLWSEFPSASAAQIRFSLCQARGNRRNTIVPPLLDAWAAFQKMASDNARTAS